MSIPSQFVEVFDAIECNREKPKKMEQSNYIQKSGFRLKSIRKNITIQLRK